MSEYQRLMFRAIDKPVSGENMKFMRRQSTRAEISPLSFDCSYNYSDFGGDEKEMLCRGYDIFFHYANFGYRRLLIRLPEGLPNPEAAQPYLGGCLKYEKDKNGPGGILRYEPDHEPGDLDYIYDLDSTMESLIPLREEIRSGDLRPLYLLSLIESTRGMGEGDDDEEDEDYREKPVPAGLDELTKAQETLADVYELDFFLIEAVAEESPKLAKKTDLAKFYAKWLEKQPEKVKNAWLMDLLVNPDSEIKHVMLAEFRKSQPTSFWPTVDPGRPTRKLLNVAKKLREDYQKQKAEKAAQERAQKIAGIVANPHKIFQETERLVEESSSEAYTKLAALLAEVREALQGTSQQGLAERQALKLKTANPTKRVLISKLRAQGFLPK